jgi:hypothetical protein
MKRRVKSKGFWTKPRKDIPLIRLYVLLGVSIIVSLVMAPAWVLKVLVAAVVLGIVIAVFLRLSRKDQL